MPPRPRLAPSFTHPVEASLGERLAVTRVGVFASQKRQRSAEPERFTREQTNDDDDSDDSSSTDDAEGGEDDELARGGGAPDDAVQAARRRNKHAPAELPSNRPVGRFRQVVDVPRVVRRGE